MMTGFILTIFAIGNFALAFEQTIKIDKATTLGYFAGVGVCLLQHYLLG